MKPLGERLYEVLYNDADESFFSLMDVISKIKVKMLKGTPAEILALRDEVKLKVLAAQWSSIQKATARLVEAHSEQIGRQKAIMETGDKDFDEFRKTVLDHDFFYSFSDDQKVWRHGETERKIIEDFVEKRGGMYRTYWEHFKKIQNKA